MTRTLNDALKRAEVLRSFRDTNSERFERNADFEDIVILADALIKLRWESTVAAIPEGEKQNLHFFGDGDGSAPIYESMGVGKLHEEVIPCTHDSFTPCPRCNVGYYDSVTDDHDESW